MESRTLGFIGFDAGGAIERQHISECNAKADRFCLFWKKKGVTLTA
jgi:hypothetical protein